MRLLFVTNFCPHYRVRTFEILAGRADVQFVFFSAGDEWYWGQKHGPQRGAFPHEYLWGFPITRWVRVTPKLLRILWSYDGDAILKCITGRFALPVSLLIAKVRRKPFVLWTGMWQHPKTAFHALTYPMTRLIYRFADAIVVYGEHVKQYLVSIGVAPRKIFVAPHAVDNSAYNRLVSEDERQALRRRFVLGERRVALYVGRLEASKGVEALLEGYAGVRIPHTVLVIVGDGSLRVRLERLATELGISERVVFTGYMGPADTVAFYSLADVLVLPSVTVRAGKEPWGLVVNEAMNQGTPVVATTAVGAAMGGLVQPGRTGEVVPERDAGALAGAIRRIIGDSVYRQQLSEGALQVIRGWDNDQMIDGFLQAVAYAVEQGQTSSRAGRPGDGTRNVVHSNRAFTSE
jgi:glycosyltransferase involved in cell wall biosynthesis